MGKLKVFIGSASRFLRGLVAEKKGDNWELSKGNVAFWIVLAHCVYTWTKSTNSIHELLDNIKLNVSDPEVTTNVMAIVSKISDIPEYEFLTLMALLTYSGAKIATDKIKTKFSKFSGGEAK